MAKNTEQELTSGGVFATFINGESSAITKNQVVKLDSTVEQVKKTAATTDIGIGIVYNESIAAAARGTILIAGPIVKGTVDTGETIAYGNYVGPGGTVAGAIAKVTPGVGNKKVLGIAIPLTSRTATETCPYILMPQDINLATS